MTSKDAFSNFPDFVSENTDFQPVRYLRIKDGYPVTIRIIDDKSFYVAKHYIPSQRMSIVCLGEQCPICQRNAEIRAKHGRNARNQSGFFNVQHRNMVNVLDRTLVVVDEETGDEYYAYKGTFPTTTKDGERSLVDVEPRPSNTIKILERGRSLFDDINVLHNEYLEEGGITAIDLKIIANGSGPDMSVSIVPKPKRDEPVDELLANTSDERYVLETVSVQLSPDEMLEFAYGGVALRDIFAKRRAEDASDVDRELQSSLADVEDSIESLFGDDD